MSQTSSLVRATDAAGLGSAMGPVISTLRKALGALRRLLEGRPSGFMGEKG